MQGFRGTICDVKEKEYLLHKINNTQSVELETVELNLSSLKTSLEKLIKRLNPKDFEVFVDLIFRSSGWSRIGTLGKTTKDIDIELLTPITNERAVVQIKSQSNLKTFKEYKNRLAGFVQDYEKIFFVTHSPSKDLADYIEKNQDEEIIFYDSRRISELCINAGLIEWLINVAT